MMEANSCRPMPNSLGVLTLLIYDANFTLQSSRKSERNGKQRRRRKRLHAKPTKSDTAPTCNSALTKEALLKRLSMDRCDRRSASLANLLNIPNFLPSGTNLQPLATALLLSTARRVQVSPRAWLSMPPPTAMRTTVQIVTTAVTPSRPTDKTRKCTSRTTRNVLPVQKPTPSMTCLKTIKMVKIQVYQKRTRLFHRIEQASLDDSPYGGSLPICCEPMQQFQHLSYGAVLAFPFGGGCMFLIGCVHNGGYFSTDARSENGLTIDVGELLQCLERYHESEGEDSCSNIRYAGCVIGFPLIFHHFKRLSKIPKTDLFILGARTIACKKAFETRNNLPITLHLIAHLLSCFAYRVIFLGTSLGIIGASVSAFVSSHRQRGTNQCEVDSGSP